MNTYSDGINTVFISLITIAQLIIVSMNVSKFTNEKVIDLDVYEADNSIII